MSPRFTLPGKGRSLLTEFQKCDEENYEIVADLGELHGLRLTPLAALVLGERYLSGTSYDPSRANYAAQKRLNDYLAKEVHKHHHLTPDGWSALTTACIRLGDCYMSSCMQFVYDYFFMTPKLYWYEDIISDARPVKMMGVPIFSSNDGAEIMHQENGDALELALKSENLELVFLVIPAFYYKMKLPFVYSRVSEYLSPPEAAPGKASLSPESLLFREQLRMLYRVFDDSLEQFKHAPGDEVTSTDDSMHTTESMFGSQRSLHSLRREDHGVSPDKAALLDELKKLVKAIFVARDNICGLDYLRMCLEDISDASGRQQAFIDFLHEGTPRTKHLVRRAHENISKQFSDDTLAAADPDLGKPVEAARFLKACCASLRALLAYYTGVPSGRLFHELSEFLTGQPHFGISLLSESQQQHIYCSGRDMSEVQSKSRYCLPFLPHKALNELACGGENPYDLFSLLKSYPLAEQKGKPSEKSALYRQVIFRLAEARGRANKDKKAAKKQATDLVITARRRFLSFENISYLKKVYKSLADGTSRATLMAGYREAKLQFEGCYELSVFTEMNIPLISMATLLKDTPFVRRLVCFYDSQMSDKLVRTAFFDDYGCNALFISVLLESLDCFIALLPVFGRSTNCLAVSCLDFALAVSDFKGRELPDGRSRDGGDEATTEPDDDSPAGCTALRLEEQTHKTLLLSLSDPYVQRLAETEWNMKMW